MTITSDRSLTKNSLQLKSSHYTLTTLQLHSDQLPQIQALLESKIQQAPNFFCNTPVILDLQHLENQADLPLAELKQLLIDLKLVLVGLKNVQPELRLHIKQHQLAIFAASQASSNAAKTMPKDPKPSTPTSKLIDTPVRSGQQVYMPHGDLIIQGAVSPGAELMAAGNIHIYGPLRGRALAGIHGDTRAKIFCHTMEAELISIAGCYKLNENISLEHKTQPSVVALKNNNLIVKAL